MAARGTYQESGYLILLLDHCLESNSVLLKGSIRHGVVRWLVGEVMELGLCNKEVHVCL